MRAKIFPLSSYRMVQRSFKLRCFNVHTLLGKEEANVDVVINLEKH